MKVHIDITHPAHVHFFRPVISALRERGDGVSVTSRDKDVTLRLLDHFGIEHMCLSRASGTPLGLVRESVHRDIRLARILRKERARVVLAREGAFAAQAGWLARCPSVSFDDTDDATLQLFSYASLATRIYTDPAYGRRFGSKHRHFNGVMAAAYLSPQRFKPEFERLRGLGIDTERPIILLRLVNWAASHDVGQKGFEKASLLRLLRELEAYGRILITSEGPLLDELAPYRASVPPEQLHHVMAAASLYVGESATMAAESAILGIPSIHVSTRTLWYTDLLEKKWGLVRNVRSAEEALDIAVGLLKDPETRSRHQQALNSYLVTTDDIVQVVLRAVDEFR